MSLELGLRALLLNRLPIRALIPDQVVGKQTFACVFNENAAQGVEPPFILIHQIDFDPMVHLGGTSGMTQTEIDIDCHAHTLPAAIAIAAKVEAYLKDYTGMAGSDDTIDSVIWTGKRYDRVFDGSGRDVVRNIVSLSFEILSTAT